MQRRHVYVRRLNIVLGLLLVAGIAWSAAGIQDQICTRLSKVVALKVISRTSTMRFAGTPENLPEIARELGVAVILEGSVQRAGEVVHIDTDLEMLAKPPTFHPEACEAYLRGPAVEKRLTDPGVSRDDREHAYRQAVDLEFALAWARLSQAHTVHDCIVDHTPERMAKARAALDQAQRLAPDTGETWEALGMFREVFRSDYLAAGDAHAQPPGPRPRAGGVLVMMGNRRRRQGRAAVVGALRLEQALPILYGDLPEALRVNPVWSPMRDSPGLAAPTAAPSGTP